MTLLSPDHESGPERRERIVNSTTPLWLQNQTSPSPSLSAPLGRWRCIATFPCPPLSLLTKLHTQWPHFRSSNFLDLFLPLGLCICCSLCLAQHSLRHPLRHSLELSLYVASLERSSQTTQNETAAPPQVILYRITHLSPLLHFRNLKLCLFVNARHPPVDGDSLRQMSLVCLVHCWCKTGTRGGFAGRMSDFAAGKGGHPFSFGKRVALHLGGSILISSEMMNSWRPLFGHQNFSLTSLTFGAR